LSDNIVLEESEFVHALKGIVHFKMKILSSYTHPQFVSNLNLFLLLNIKEDILKNVSNHTYGANYVPKLNKQIQHFANKLNLLCEGKLDSQTNRKQFANIKWDQKKCKALHETNTARLSP